MSFRCDQCQTQYPSFKHPGVRAPIRVVVRAQARKYNHNHTYSLGWEIVQEADLCIDCAALHRMPAITLTDALTPDELAELARRNPPSIAT